MRALLHFLLPLLAILVACSDGKAPTLTPTAVTSRCETILAIHLPSVSFPTAPGSPSLFVEVADTSSERATGLSNRDCLAANAGMLFAWPADTNTGFWMKDTHIPLSVAFIRADGVIVSIQDMQPETTETHTSPLPYRYAIEANQGWFAETGVEVGGVVEISESLSEQADG